ncbi:MAG: D-2-hydroxyacid dehydrogenase [Bacillota bacterium]
MLVFIYHPQAESVAAKVRSAHPHLEVVGSGNLADVHQYLPHTTVLFTAGFGRLDLGRAASLRWVQTVSAGVDRLVSNLPPGVVLTRGHGLHNVAMSEHCLGRILAHALNLRQALKNQAERRWERYPVERISGKVLGIAGLGVIGSAIARRARAFDMRVTGLRRVAVPAEGVERVYGREELHEFLSTADYVVILLPLTSETHGMFGSAEFEVMKPGAVLMNMGRGQVVKEPELIEGLKRGRPSHALLDVFEEEPLPSGSELWSLPNVTITPHNAGGSTLEDAMALFLENLDRFQSGQPLKGAVDPRLGY